ncbi:hypothetical protein [Nannocystis pusilla]|uniref:hypothetical protein n=1 Tax=Nannocystis pusilla TaxID=889268 RepID=UPI003B81ACB6
MFVSRRAASLLLSLSFACQGQVGEPTDTAAATTTTTTSGTGSTTTTTGTSTAGEGSTIDDGCAAHAIGDWGQCAPGNLAGCEWQASGTNGELLCLAPTSGGFNVCGIRNCVDACDCFAPPATGTAVPVCAAILGSGASGCALYCAGGQVCPDGMQCQSGYCYWEG